MTNETETFTVLHDLSVDESASVSEGNNINNLNACTCYCVVERYIKSRRDSFSVQCRILERSEYISTEMLCVLEDLCGTARGAKELCSRGKTVETFDRELHYAF